MSHLHIGDGFLPWWLWIGGLVVALALVLLASLRLKNQRHLVPSVAVVAAVALVAMNIALGLPVHVNLAALAGIILGPLNGFLAMFIVNLFNALIGHGGLTVLGINSLLVGSEALVAGALFLLLGRAKRLLPNVAISVTVALLVSTLLVVVVAGIAGGGLEAMAGQEQESGDSGFLKTFGALMGLPMAVWLVAELGLSLLAVSYVQKVKGDWFSRSKGA